MMTSNKNTVDLRRDTTGLNSVHREYMARRAATSVQTPIANTGTTSEIPAATTMFERWTGKDVTSATETHRTDTAAPMPIRMMSAADSCRSPATAT